MNEVLKLHMTVQNNRLRSERLALELTQPEFAKLLTISAAYYGDIENLRVVPTEDMKISIAILLEKPIDYLFPEYLMKGIQNGRFANRTKFLDEQETKKIAAVQTSMLISDGGIEAAEQEVYTQQLRKVIDKSLSTLTKRQHEVLTLYYGLDGGRAKTSVEIAEMWHVSRSYPPQVIQKALRKLRHPYRSRRIKEFIDG